MPCKECVIRQTASEQTYTVTGDEGTITFNVSKAIKMVSDGRPSIEVPEFILESILYVNVVEEEHLDHVDSSIPGILGIFKNKLMAIDGSHRAAKCRREGKPYHIYALSPKETVECIIHYDPDNKEGIKGVNA